MVYLFRQWFSNVSCIFFFTAAGILLCQHAAVSQDAETSKQAKILVKTLTQNHFSPRKVDDSLSADILRQFIKSLDPEDLLFSHQDYQQMLEFQYLIDDDLSGKSWAFLPMATALYKERLLDAESTIKQLMLKPLNFSKDEVIQFQQQRDQESYTGEELQLRWEKRLKYKTLLQVYFAYDSLADTKGVQALVLDAQKYVMLREERRINRVLDYNKGFDRYVALIFLNAITSCFDPHSVYLSHEEWAAFRSELSVESLSFGLYLDEEKNGQVRVSRLVPGGPAWKSGAFNKGDILLAMRPLKAKTIDLQGMDIEEVMALLADQSLTVAEFKLKKTTGAIKAVQLAKEKVDQEENMVQSFILNADVKIGYISLPGFYTEWENMSGLGCANDVAKEIVKLKAEHIKGLILDLRNNGGGSIDEALNLAGIFIDEGPLYVVKYKDGKPETVKDMNRGTIYDGPLLLMVNGHSASASELVAAALQDYNRAVIVGSPTFGKASGQAIFPLDHSLQNLQAMSTDMGVVSTTMLKLYRIKGNSIQAKGLTPDIMLPEVNFDAYKEVDLPFALPNDAVVKKVYYTPLPALPIDILRENSEKRVRSDPGFSALSKVIVPEVIEVPLQWPGFFATMNKMVPKET